MTSEPTEEENGIARCTTCYRCSHALKGCPSDRSDHPSCQGWSKYGLTCGAFECGELTSQSCLVLRVLTDCPIV